MMMNIGKSDEGYKMKMKMKRCLLPTSLMSFCWTINENSPLVGSDSDNAGEGAEVWEEVQAYAGGQGGQGGAGG